MRTERPLVLEVERHELSVGQPTTLRVRDRSGRPVEGATISVGSTRTRTDSNGLCEVTVQTPGYWKVRASAPPTDRVVYEPATTLLRVVPGSTRTRGRSHLAPEQP